MSEVQTRTVQFKLDPALAAYFAWLDAVNGYRMFDPIEYDRFSAGYRAHAAEVATNEVQAFDAGWRQGHSDGYDNGLDDANADTAPAAAMPGGAR